MELSFAGWRGLNRRAAASGVLLGLCAVGGCNVIGAAMYKFSPPPEVPAKYTLKNVPTVVLVENYRNPDLSANESELLGRYVQEKLSDKKLVTIVPSEKILDLKNTRPSEYSRMTIPDIGKAVGAEQVIYIDLQAAGVGSMAGDFMYKGKGAAAVKVVDCKTGDTLWPTDSADGFGISYETPALKGGEGSTYNGVRDQLFNGFADRIAKLFYTWRQEDTPSQGRS